MEILLPLVLAFLTFGVWTTADRHASRNQTRACPGTSNGLSRTSTLGLSRLEYVRRFYENCTTISGNLELTHINNRSETLQLPYIREITGYLLIYRANIARISLPSLEIIWGENFQVTYSIAKNATKEDKVEHENRKASLVVFSNHELSQLDLRSLREVHHHAVYISRNPRLCFLHRHIDWSQLLVQQWSDFSSDVNWTRRLHSDDAHEQYCALHEKVHGSCHNDCDASTGKKSCWGPGPQQCQKIYRSKCVRQCLKPMCQIGMEQTQLTCCDSACAAGCTGPQANECIHCAKFKNVESGECVSDCDGFELYDMLSAMWWDNPNGMYKFKKYCVKTCPLMMVAFGNNCVTNCPKGYFAEKIVKNNTEMYICRSCAYEKGRCPKKCSLENQPLNSLNVKLLKGCTHLTGSLIIHQHHFTEKASYYDKEAGNMIVYPPLKLEDLENLSSLTEISGHLYVSVGGTVPLKSLEFLRNLQVIKGIVLNENRFSVEIVYNQELTHLGLNSLREIRNGKIYIDLNPKLCLEMSLPWQKRMFRRSSGSHAMLGIVRGENGQKVNCSEMDCNESCVQELGCWGPNNSSFCFECKKFRANGRCVENCDSFEAFYSDLATSTCLPCHELCANCTGPSITDCTSCKYVQLGIGCLLKCPKGHYTKGGLCKPCKGKF